MATQLNPASVPDELPKGDKFRIGIVVAEFNFEITGALLKGAVETLEKACVKPNNIFTAYVPGAFELPLAASKMLSVKDVDAVICIGAVIKGETPHFEYICQAVAQGCMDASLKFQKPVVFGVLTTLDMQQAQDRAGGRYGNKGSEAAVTALKMLTLF